jgi:ribosomal protein S14|uniref:Small ribosomal subunit protein uS14m n=1 Tax=Lobosphaera incisa TaxID=312850 RepID=A0A0F6XQX8_9CHLO|nr:ribosomal protein S14 [Lobosphaera incisa]AKF78652.1 ribosomal protein S14 [Lobosphaera incisa]
MSNSIQRDKKIREIVARYELKRLECKSIIKNLSISPIIRQKLSVKLNKLPRNSSRTRIRNRCILTGRGRGVYRFCKLSRIHLRELGGKGVLTGIKKSSW